MAVSLNANYDPTERHRAVVEHGHRPFVSYIVLTDMVKAGWRRIAEPIDK